eukprot:GFUD01022671.1.p1 GENE.GFUD01022671.1~~GFUD01022671.1.p1  ORF type:complete len:313 (-),score=114.02 GFUD01022671.1:76-1014(-)
METSLLPQLCSPSPFLSDGGLETWLIYSRNCSLPHFAAFPLLDTPEGVDHLKEYYKEYLQVAHVLGMGLVLSTPTWRASTRWGMELGYTQEKVDQFNREAVKLLKGFKNISEDEKLVVDGQIGPMEDGYKPEVQHSVQDSKEYHKRQVEVLNAAGVDLVSAMTITNWEEAVGVSLAAMECRVPLAVGFTVELDGRLPSGDMLADAVEKVDQMTGGYPSYYLVNCAHPDHIRKALEYGGKWRERVMGFRVNASRRSHEELDRMESLDEGDPEELGHLTGELGKLVPRVVVMGGCCGTSAEHVRKIGSQVKQHK